MFQLAPYIKAKLKIIYDVRVINLDFDINIYVNFPYCSLARVGTVFKCIFFVLESYS